MKKRKNRIINNFLKTRILLFGITLLFFGCKDNDQILELETTQTIVKPTIKHTNFSELEKDTQFANLIEKLNLNQMTDVYQLKSGISARNSSNDFTIITNSIKEVQTPTSHSYNILIERNTPTENVIENLVLQNNNGVEKSLIFKYTLKDSNVSARGTTGNNDIDVEVDEISVSDYNGTGGGGNGNTGASNQTCHYETVYVEKSCFGPGSSGNHYGEYSNCKCGDIITTCNPPITWSTLVEVCENNNNGVITGTWNYNTDNSNISNTNNNDDTVDTNQSLAVLTPAVNDHLKHLKKIINTPFSSSPTIEEYYGKTNTITSYLALKKPVLFNDLDIIIREIDVYSLNLEETKAIYDKAFAIYGVSQNYDLNTIYSIDQLSVFDQNTIAQNSLFISFLPNLKSLGIELPQTTEEWAELGEILVEVMYEIIPDLIPGIAELNSLKNSISAFNSGNYTDGTTELAFALIGVFPAGKLMKALAKFAKLAKKTVKIFKTYLKLFKLNKPLAKGYKRVIKITNDMDHIFDVDHKLATLVANTGGEKEALLAAVNRIQELGLYGAIPNGQYKRFTNVNVLGESLTIDIFKNLDGSITHISNMWKP